MFGIGFGRGKRWNLGHMEMKIYHLEEFYWKMFIFIENIITDTHICLSDINTNGFINKDYNYFFLKKIMFFIY